MRQIDLNAEAQTTQRIAKAKSLRVSLRPLRLCVRKNSSPSTSIRGHKLLSLVALAIAATLTLNAAQKPASKTKPAQTKSALSTEDASIEALTAKALRSVVVIKHFGRDGREDGVGAGFIISEDGLVATSLHVIGEARPITVQLADGKRHEVTEIFASDRNFDLAIVRIAANKLPALPLGSAPSSAMAAGTSGGGPDPTGQTRQYQAPGGSTLTGGTGATTPTGAVTQ